MISLKDIASFLNKITSENKQSFINNLIIVKIGYQRQSFVLFGYLVILLFYFIHTLMYLFIKKIVN